MKKLSLSFGQYLFFTVIAVYSVFVASFLYFQYHREKQHRVELLDAELRSFNLDLHDSMSDSTFADVSAYVSQYRVRHNRPKLRVTLINRQGKVLFDNGSVPPEKMENHLDREEIQEALKGGSGCSIKRTSATLGEPFFYSATFFPDRNLFIRSALPYDAQLVALMNADRGYLWFTFLISALLFLVFYNLTNRLGTMITQLRIFARSADRDEAVNTNSLEQLGDTDLGQISRHIIDIYNRLRKTKDDLYLEREKLITHLQVSNEGLAIFNPSRDVVLSNGLFMQYVNLISDKNISEIDDIFKMKDFKPVTDFINNSTESYTLGTAPNARHPLGNVRRKLFLIDKNGYIFNLSVALFADNSFEISVSDITKQEEQARMKQQITQNVAHELKTPVSSIQGYLETILNNPGLSPDLLKKFLERCFAQSNRLTNLLQDISTLTRLTEASRMIDTAPLDLAPVIHGIVTELSLKLEEKHMTVAVNIPTKMPIQGNSSLLYSIFRNLMDNAIAYAGNGTNVNIVCYSSDNDCYYFSFSDNGAGVAPEHLGRLFERFYRVDKGRSRKAGGTGLGLAIVKNAVIFHGGNINAKLANGHGLEFLFTLRKKKEEE